MAKVLFLNGNLHGHINPTLPIVKELVHRGEEVYYLSTKEFQKKIEEHGATFMDLGEEFDKFLLEFRPHGNHPFYTLMEYMLGFDHAIMKIVLDRIADIQFDFLIHDVMFGAGKIIAAKLHIPAISSCSSFVMEEPPIPASMLKPGYHVQLDYLYHQLEQVKEEWKLPALTLNDIFFKKEECNIVYTSKYFHPNSDSLDDSYQFIGPSLMKRDEELDFTINKSRYTKLIYISMGTINNKCLDLYHHILKAFNNTDYQVVLSIGNKIDITELGDIPENYIVRNYIPQLEILKQADLFISHGGLNSVSEAFYHRVPVIAIPMANDQPAVGKRIDELGAGISLNPDSISAELLRTTAEHILRTESYYQHARDIQDSFIHAGGYLKGTNVILDYIHYKNLKKV